MPHAPMRIDHTKGTINGVCHLCHVPFASHPAGIHGEGECELTAPQWLTAAILEMPAQLESEIRLHPGVTASVTITLPLAEAARIGLFTFLRDAGYETEEIDRDSAST